MVRVRCHTSQLTFSAGNNHRPFFLSKNSRVIYIIITTRVDEKVMPCVHSLCLSLVTQADRGRRKTLQFVDSAIGPDRER